LSTAIAHKTLHFATHEGTDQLTRRSSARGRPGVNDGRPA
jgi:hypothetical protein